MLTLGIDTASNQCAAALWRGDGATGACAGWFAEPMARGHAEALFPLLERLLARTGTTPSDIDRVAVVSGPGTFTGVRLGVAAIRGLALALGVPAVPVSAFALLHAGLAAAPAGPVAIVLEPRRGMVDLQILAPDGTSLSEPAAIDPDTALDELGPDLCAVAGPGASLVSDAAQRAGRPVQVLPPPGRDVVHVARLGSSLAPIDDMVPLYIRPPDAKVPTAPSLRAAP